MIAAYKVLSGLTGIELPSRTSIGPRLQIQHGFGLVVHGDTVIGERCVLKQGVTIGLRTAGGPSPTIGNRVQFGPSSQIIGGVTIGDRALIGSGAIVLDDVPEGAVVASPKATILRIRPAAGL